MSTWKDHVLRVTPYVPGEQPQGTDIIKLNTNENPYPPSPGVQEVMRTLDAEELRRYPDPDASRLIQALAHRYKVPADQIFAGVGSDDVLALAFLTFFSREYAGAGQTESRLIFPDVTYSFYRVWAALYGIPCEEVPLGQDFTLWDAGAVPSGVRGIVIANPNAPTGIAAPLTQIEEIVRCNPQCVVIVDEAYIDFGGESALPLIGRYDNLLVVQTFSKSRSMAGMRIGYAFGNKELISALKAVKFSVNSYTLNLPSILAGEAALQDEAYFQETVDRIKATRERTSSSLNDIGFTTLTSAANFLFTRPPGNHAREIYEHLRVRGIYVRYFDAPRTRDYLRITVGTDNEINRLIEVLKTLI